MTVITVINTAYKVYKIVKRFNARMKPYGPYEQWSSRFPPNYRPYVRDVLKGADIAFSGGLISEAIHFGLDGFSSKPPTKTSKVGEGGSYSQSPGSRPFQQSGQYSRYSRRQSYRCRPGRNRRYR